MRAQFLYPALLGAALGFFCLSSRARAEPPRLQMEGSLAGAPIGFAGTPGVRTSVGLILSDHWTLLTTVAAGYSRLHGEGSFNSGSSTSVGVPLELLGYLRKPGTSVITPTLRIGAGYAYARNHWTGGAGVSSSNTSSHGAFAEVLAGVTYFANEHIGVGAELGPDVSFGTYKHSPQSWSYGLGWTYRLGVTLRL